MGVCCGRRREDECAAFAREEPSTSASYSYKNPRPGWRGLTSGRGGVVSRAQLKKKRVQGDWRA